MCYRRRYFQKTGCFPFSLRRLSVNKKKRPKRVHITLYAYVRICYNHQLIGERHFLLFFFFKSISNENYYYYYPVDIIIIIIANVF